MMTLCTSTNNSASVDQVAPILSSIQTYHTETKKTGIVADFKAVSIENDNMEVLQRYIATISKTGYTTLCIQEIDKKLEKYCIIKI